jgi:hypothetical protein
MSYETGNPRCKVCGQPLDVSVDPKGNLQEVSECTNPECPSNSINPRRK